MYPELQMQLSREGGQKLQGLRKLSLEWIELLSVSLEAKVPEAPGKWKTKFKDCFWKVVW